MIQTTNQITGQRRWWALATVMVTMFFAAVDQTIVSTAIPTIISDLQGFALYAWVFSANGILIQIIYSVHSDFRLSPGQLEIIRFQDFRGKVNLLIPV